MGAPGKKCNQNIFHQNIFDPLDCPRTLFPLTRTFPLRWRSQTLALIPTGSNLVPILGVLKPALIPSRSKRRKNNGAGNATCTITHAPKKRLDVSGQYGSSFVAQPRSVLVQVRRDCVSQFDRD